ncbi:MAG: hypothetical protein WHT06_08125 [Desulfobacterales bacterium]
MPSCPHHPALFALALLLAGMLFVCPARAQKADELRSIVAVGLAPQSGAPAAGREAAIADAILRAVAAAAFESLPPERLAEGFRRLNEEVLSRPGDFVHDYRLLAETPFGREHRVLLQVTVNERLLRGRLASAGIGPAEGPAAEDVRQIPMSVEGSAQLAHFVRFRRALLEIPGVEGIQVQEIRGHETALVVAFRGEAGELARRLAAKSFDAFTVAVSERPDGGLRALLAPR